MAYYINYISIYIVLTILAYFSRKIQTSRVNNSKILGIQNVKFSGYYFHMNTNIWRDFEICISVPLSLSFFNFEKQLAQFRRKIFKNQ